ncbi:MAG: TetR/AcrR family transcriptional regulator [Planctomycetota bacterium]|nr:TetR/AcrR family transcriptional regulator [Planctomycetota bacterium]
MRLRDENKRRTIVRTAVRLFSEQPFHKVRLDDVAAGAGIGKGTVYIYFKSKEDLYYSSVYDGFSELVKSLAGQLNEHRLPFDDKIRVIIRGLVEFSVRYPQLFEVMRTVGVPDASSEWDGKRRELSRLVENVIREGVAAGEFTDSRPDQTSLYLLAMVRAVMQYGASQVDGDVLTQHLASVLLNGIRKEIVPHRVVE